MTRQLAILVTALAVGGTAFAISASAAPTGQTTRATSAARCLKPPRPLVQALKDGLKRKARGKLRKARAVKSHKPASSGAPSDLRKGVYYVSARVRHFGIATWAAGRRAFKTGGGIIVSVNKVARKVSNLGDLIPPTLLQAWGLSNKSRAAKASRRCVM